METKQKQMMRDRRHRRVRKRVEGTAERPRLVVFRSARHIYAQVVDDLQGRTITSASSLEPAFRGEQRGSNIPAAGRVGRVVAERARAAGVAKVVFDRGGYLYHGRVKALAEGARAGGLEF